MMTSQGYYWWRMVKFKFDKDAVDLILRRFGHSQQDSNAIHHFDNVKLTEIIKRRLQPRPKSYTNFDIGIVEEGKSNSILSAMARDLLTVQASTVASESAFSISGRIISERRSRLTPNRESPILEDVEETIARKEVDLGISPPNTELDEGEFEDLDIEHVDVEDFFEDLMDYE
ncbi:putative transcription elongation factor SPT5-like protein 1 [Tanacetum coccineum]|uniref:Transcription elongation factor SPT5-like protein 1 n=1 Tax=Tanacetum coccineum TaxID=301880 RepID=A0ABQ5HDD3_9ASTR